MIKKIGITQKMLTTKNGICFQLDKDWFDYFSKFNAILIPIGFDKFNDRKIEKLNLDGIIVSGGGNIFNLEKNIINFQRDNFEKKIISKFQKKNKPILLVCRGFQLLANSYGSKIIKIDNHVKVMHKIFLLKKLFSEKKNNFITNSFHNYGFKKIGKKFEVLGMSKDGSIEFAKVKKFKTYCMMFHPERYNIDQSSIDKLIKKIFLI
tara:strand:- start:1356 stop:1976 length:621 start_codon:yes stop_codon:yes gene_type:complete